MVKFEQMFEVDVEADTHVEAERIALDEWIDTIAVSQNVYIYDTHERN